MNQIETISKLGKFGVRAIYELILEVNRSTTNTSTYSSNRDDFLIDTSFGFISLFDEIDFSNLPIACIHLGTNASSPELMLSTRRILFRLLSYAKKKFVTNSEMQKNIISAFVALTPKFPPPASDIWDGYPRTGLTLECYKRFVVKRWVNVEEHLRECVERLTAHRLIENIDSVSDTTPWFGMFLGNYVVVSYPVWDSGVRTKRIHVFDESVSAFVTLFETMTREFPNHALLEEEGLLPLYHNLSRIVRVSFEYGNE